jgi:hypothetical protein
MTDETQNQPGVNNLPPIKLAFIVDNEVADILHTDERLSAIFTSNPLVLDVTDRFGKEEMSVGYIYNPETDTFSKPTQEESSGQ